MAEEFGFFPDETYGPDDFTTYFRDFYSNGIMADDTSYFAVKEKSGMTLTVKKGIAYIDGHFYRPPADLTVTLAESDTEFDRIDLIEVKCDYVTNKVYVDVVVGEPSGKPTIPHLQRDAAAYCLGLATVTVKANTANVTQADIKDLRFDTNYCGVVVGKINTISTTDLFTQYEAQWELLKAGCAQDAEAVIAAWSALNTVKKVNGIVPTNGNIDLTQSLIPSDGTAYQFPFFIQSGTVTVNSSSYQGIGIEFPIKFKSEPILLLSATNYIQMSSYIVTVAGYNDVTTDGFVIAVRTLAGSSISTPINSTVRWVALGEIDL